MSSGKASKFMDAHHIEIKERVNATRKLGEEEAVALIQGAGRVIIAKGKKVADFRSAKKISVEEILPLMLGSTGNLRAPTIRRGKTVVVGFNEEIYRELFS